MQQASIDPTSPICIASQDDLRSGIWPRSFSLWMAVVYVALFVIRPWEKLIPELGAIHFERCFAILMVSVVMLSGGFRLRLNLQTTTVMLFTGALFLSGLTVGGLSWPYLYLTLVVFYLVLISVIRTPYEMIFMVACYLVTMGVYLGKSQWEFFVHGSGRNEMGVLRLQGIEATFGNDNALAASVVLSLPVFYFLIKVRNEFSVIWPGVYRRWFFRGLFVYSILAVSSVILTRSRTGAIGLVFFMILLVMRMRDIPRMIISLTMIGVACVGIYSVQPPEAQNRLKTIWSSAAESDDTYTQSARASAEGRRIGFRIGRKMFRDHPMFGVGVDNFIPYRKAHLDGVTLAAHNLYGDLIGEAGLIGTMTFSMMVLAILLNYRTVRRLASYFPTQPVPWVMSELALACRDVVILLFLFGMTGDTTDRFNWLWAAAFCWLAVQFSVSAVSDHVADDAESYPNLAQGGL